MTKRKTVNAEGYINLIVPNPNFRPNVNRAVYVQGLIDQQLINRLTPRITLLQGQNREPITVFIDSPGGQVNSAETLLKLLTATNQDFARPCRIITVVTARAASAAADLLSAGDYAIAYPHSTILYHGIRMSENRPLTAEVTSILAQALRMASDSYAMELARKIEFRFMFRFVMSKGSFDEIRKRNPMKTMSDLECFFDLLSANLSPDATKLLETARKRYSRYDALLSSFLARSKRIAPSKRKAELEAAQIKAIVAFELRENKENPNWSFQGFGLKQLGDDFALLNEYLQTSQSARFKKLCADWAYFLLPDSESGQIDSEKDEAKKSTLVAEKVGPLLQPVWSFFVALCHALQEGENELTANDAIWLGLIDEVMGVKLPTSRMMAEYKKDEEEKDTSKEKIDAAAGA